jgi:hypothetical protein
VLSGGVPRVNAPVQAHDDGGRYAPFNTKTNQNGQTDRGCENSDDGIAATGDPDAITFGERRPLRLRLRDPGCHLDRRDDGRLLSAE